MSPPPLPFTYLGGVMVPRRARQTEEHYGEGEIVMLVPHEDRSDVTHKHEFAWLREAWLNLPEGLADQFPSPEHLRKRALIDTGWYTETIIDAGSNAAALRFAAYLRGDDEFALIIVRGPLVAVRKARSQSRRAMGAADFQKSKTDILEAVADLLSVTPQQLAGRSDPKPQETRERQREEA